MAFNALVILESNAKSTIESETANCERLKYNDDFSWRTEAPNRKGFGAHDSAAHKSP